MSRSTHAWFTDSEDWSAWTADKTALLKAFVDFVLGTEGQGMLSDFSFTVVPAAMNTWSTVWTSTIVKPAGFGTANELTFEGNTEKWVGQGANVVSSKRDSYSLWKLNDLESQAAAMKLVQQYFELQSTTAGRTAKWHYCVLDIQHFL